MSWSYEIRGENNRLVEIRGGFATKKAAREAGERAKRMIDCICHPNLELLSVLTKSGTLPSHVAEPEAEWKYPWQRLVLDAFREPDSTRVLCKIAAAEQALAARLRGATPPGSQEHLAVGQALLALGRLLSQLESHGASRECEESSEETA